MIYEYKNPFKVGDRVQFKPESPQLQYARDAVINNRVIRINGIKEVVLQVKSGWLDPRLEDGPYTIKNLPNGSRPQFWGFNIQQLVLLEPDHFLND